MRPDADPNEPATPVELHGLLSVEGLSVRFPIGRTALHGPRSFVHALNHVSLTVDRAETVAVVGESGSGKSTLGYTVLGWHTPSAGRVVFDGRDVTHCGPAQLRAARRQMQMIFQDPHSSLNPTMKVGEAIGEPLLVHRIIPNRAERRRKVAQLLELCGMSPTVANRYPHSFSGGQLQRIVIARALALSPKLVVADEPTSALDVSVQAQIIMLLRDLQESLGISYLFISHDLAVVRHLSHRIVILYAGQVVETGTVDKIFNEPMHPYTRMLLSAIPVPDPASDWRLRRIVGSGEAANTIDPEPGCRFANRCPLVSEQCRIAEPLLEEKDLGHRAACWHVPVAVVRPPHEIANGTGRG